jgi:hypothetical protein
MVIVCSILYICFVYILVYSIIHDIVNKYANRNEKIESINAIVIYLRFFFVMLYTFSDTKQQITVSMKLIYAANQYQTNKR